MRSVFVRSPDAAELHLYAEGRRGKVRVWWPVAFMLIVIAIESTNTFSSENTSGWIRPVVERIFGHINDRLWAMIHHFMRKSGHFVGYGGLGLALLRAWLLTLGLRAGFTRAMWRWAAVWRAVAGTAFVASLDEWHQTFIPSRTGTVWDVGLDSVGASAMCLGVWLFCGWWRRKP